ncbi:MAG: carbohydrate kinase [Gammaproteobacteria bacterium]|nr:carbohydrate kinase [Gammaproteobacteria bacterium]
MTTKEGLYIYGEVLFDHFPDGSRVLGGAPFNVAWHLRAFGQAPQLISRVGDDPEGAEVRSAMRDWGLSSKSLQTDAVHPTGRVTVTFQGGEPGYDIVPDCAYDHIAEVSLPRCNLLYHGTLAARFPTSVGTLRQLRNSAPRSVFIDVNLRSPWWQETLVKEFLRGADWVKLNSDELALLTGVTASSGSARAFLHHYQLQGLLVTKGAKGAELFLPDGQHLRVVPSPDIHPVDTVGAGDAFAAVILLGLLQEWPMALALERAQQFAAAVVGCRGATVSEPDFYRVFSQNWQLDG